MTATTSINFQTKMKKKSDHTKTVFFFPPSGGVENMILFIYYNILSVVYGIQHFPAINSPQFL